MGTVKDLSLSALTGAVDSHLALEETDNISAKPRYMAAHSRIEGTAAKGSFPGGVKVNV